MAQALLLSKVTGRQSVSHVLNIICNHCSKIHDQESYRQSLYSYSVNKIFTRNKGNWKQRRLKRETKDREENEISYVGDNATRTSIVYAWGAAVSGALGIPSYVKPEIKFKGRSKQYFLSKINRPARVRFFDEKRIKPLDIACGNGFTTFSVKIDNRKVLLATGMNTDSQLGFHEVAKGSGRAFDQLIEPGRIHLPLQHPDQCKITSMACGRAHSVFVIENEGIFTLGNNAFGQCGRAIVEDEQYRHNQRVNKVVDLPDDIIKVVCGQDHTLFLTSSGHVYSCGLGADGQTGLGHYSNVGVPTLIRGDLEGETIISLGGKGDCVVAVSDKGEVFGWGNSEYDQLGAVTDDTQVNVPKHLPVKHCGKVVKCVAGGSTCALLNDQGQVFVWGYGILGKGPNLEMSKVPSHIPDPIFGRNELSEDTKVVDLNCGLSYMAVLNNKGDIYTWGRNKDGCLGLGEDKNQYFPWKVALPAEAVAFDCGLDHVVAICKSFV